jgi:hypothetical protein
MARIPTALIPPPHREQIPPDHGLDERVETAVILLGQMLPSQVVKRLAAHYGCAIGTAYEYVARARTFLAGLRNRDRETIFHEVHERLESIALNPAASMADKLKANQLIMGLHGLRRQPAAPPQDEAPLYAQEEEDAG